MTVAAEAWTPALPHAELTKDELLAEAVLMKRRFKAFVRGAWNIVEPETVFVDNWHIDAICDALTYAILGFLKSGEWDARGVERIRRLVINIPPRSMKSLIVSVFFPAWTWTFAPHVRFLYSSYSYDRSVEDASKCRDVVQSFWYKLRWPEVQLTGINTKERFVNSARGYRIATSVGGLGTGEGGDFIVTDDPNNVRDVESEPTMKATSAWWTGSMSTRQNDPKRGVRIVIQQRVSERDVTGVCLETGRWHSLIIPMKYEADRPTRIRLPYPFADPRSGDGELMWDARFDAEAVSVLEDELGPYRTAGQLQQNPVPDEGGIFKRAWVRFWLPPGMDEETLPLPDDWSGTAVKTRPMDFDLVVISWDMTFKDTDGTDFVVGTVWGQRGATYWLLDLVRARMDFVRTLEEVQRLRFYWPQAEYVLVEDRANGPAVIAMLRDRIEGMVAVTPEGGKISRAYAVAPIWAGLGVHLPHPSLAPWVRGFLSEVLTFPRGAHDDQTDTMTQALLYLRHLPTDRRATRELEWGNSLDGEDDLSIEEYVTRWEESHGLAEREFKRDLWDIGVA